MPDQDHVRFGRVALVHKEYAVTPEIRSHVAPIPGEAPLRDTPQELGFGNDDAIRAPANGRSIIATERPGQLQGNPQRRWTERNGDLAELESELDIVTVLEDVEKAQGRLRRGLYQKRG